MSMLARTMRIADMEIKYIDAHCHLQFEQFDNYREKILEKMREEGVA